MAAAWEQVLDIVKAALEANGLTVFIGRDSEEMLHDEELDCVNLTWTGSPAEGFDCGAYYWDGEVQIDCWGHTKPSPPMNGLQSASAIAARVGAVIDADLTMSNLIPHAFVKEVGGMQNFGPDSGSISVVMKAGFSTPKGDWNTII